MIVKTILFVSFCFFSPSMQKGHVACAHHMSLDAMASWWPQNGYTDTDLMEETSATYPPAIKQKLERLVRWSEIPQISNLTSPAVISNTSTAGKVALLFPADWTETNPSTLSSSTFLISLHLFSVEFLVQQ